MSGEDRRRQILEVAIELFSQNGFRGTTTKQIAETAGVSEAIIFRHFAHKVDLYAAILDYKCHEAGREQWFQELRAIADRNDDEALFRFVAERILDVHRRDPQFQRLMLYAALEGREYSRVILGRGFPLQEFLVEYIQRRQRAGALRKANPALIVFALIAMPSYFSLVTRIFGADFLAPLEGEAAAQFSQLLFQGIGSDGSASSTVKEKSKKS